MYQFWLFLHIAAAIVAFGSNFGRPMVERASGDAPAVTSAFGKVGTYLQAPALAVLLISGILIAYDLRTPDRNIFAETWISIAFTLWILMAIVQFLVVRATKQGNDKLAAPLTGVTHLLLAAALWAMIWQPGAYS